MLRRWVEWLDLMGGPLAGLSPDGLVEYQRVHKDYVVVEALERWLTTEHRGLRWSSMNNAWTVVRSFFLHNRAMLPADPTFQIRSDVPVSEGTLTVEELRAVCLASNRMYRAVFLSMVQGGLGPGELLWWSSHGRRELEAGLDGDSLMVSLPGRKRNRNKRSYYTRLGADAMKALRDYYEVRHDGEAIFVSRVGTPLNYDSLATYWMGRLRDLGLVTKDKSIDLKRERTGKNLHEMRDVFRTRWHISGADPLCAEFQMGHTIDALGYNKFMDYHDYTAEEYAKAEPLLNIISNPESPGEHRYRRHVKVLEGKLDRREDENITLSRTNANLSDQNTQLGKLLALLQDPAKLAKILAQV